MKTFLLATVIVVVLMATANAETPDARCTTNMVVNVNTLPRDADKMWHQTDTRAPGVIWFQLSRGTLIGLYASYVDPNGVKWAWASWQAGPEYDDATITGWVKTSSLSCN